MSRSNDPQPEAGPSRPRQYSSEPYRVPLPAKLASDPNLEYITIPSTGLEYFHYRRSLFLAGLEPYPLPTPLPEFITVPKPPPPIPYTPPTGRSRNRSNEAKIEEMLESPGSQKNLIIRRKVNEIERSLKSGRKMVDGTTLSFIIKVLKYGWIQDGLWPIDARTGEPVKPPDSPIYGDQPLPST